MNLRFLFVFYLVKALLTIFNFGGEIVFFDIGQGDSILVKTPNNKKIIIDGGPSYDLDLYVSREFFPGFCNIEALVLTHPHKDHLNGLNRLMQRCNVNYVFYSPVEYDSKVYTDFKNLAAKANNSEIILKKGDLFSIDSLDFYVLWPSAQYLTSSTFSDVNDVSTVLLLDYNEKEILFTGDINSKTFDLLDTKLMESKIEGTLDVYKVAHHGSKKSVNNKFIQSFLPTISVIQAGLNNKFDHPHKQTLDSLNNVKSKILVTSDLGTIRLTL